VRFADITLYVASQRVFIVVSVYLVIDSVRKFLDTPLYVLRNKEICRQLFVLQSVRQMGADPRKPNPTAVLPVSS
jgi:hypothetical protein